MTHKDIFKGSTYKSLQEQVGGKHYSSLKIQPAEFINENRLLFAEGNAIKYICRHSAKPALFGRTGRTGLLSCLRFFERFDLRPFATS